VAERKLLRKNRTSAPLEHSAITGTPSCISLKSRTEIA
jgi:hypothetical protein